MIVILVHLVNQNSEMSDSSMESCSSEDDISSSEPRPVEVSKEGSGRGIGREKGRERGRGRVRGRASGSGRGRRTGEATVPYYMWTSADLS